MKIIIRENKITNEDIEEILGEKIKGFGFSRKCIVIRIDDESSKDKLKNLKYDDDKIEKLKKLFKDKKTNVEVIEE